MGAISKAFGGPRKWSQGLFFVLDVVWIVALLVIVFGVASRWDWLTIADPFGAVVPFVVPWAGALGGVSISLVGVAKYSNEKDWNAEQYGYWHLARPLLGCIFGTVAVLAVILLLQNVKVGTTGDKYTPEGTAILAIISFVVGYREETFRSLVVRIVDIILGPGSKEQGMTVALVPNLIDFKDVALSNTATATLRLFNGSPDTVHLTAAAVSIGPVDGLSIEPFADVDVTPNGSQEIRVKWGPTSPGQIDTNIRVAVANTNLQGRIKGTAV